VNRGFIELFIAVQRFNHPKLVVQDFATIHSMGEKTHEHERITTVNGENERIIL
jgi:hypothetical protein